MKKLSKGLYFTDIHWGKKSNSPIHLQDCSDFISWIYDIAHVRPDIEYVAFLGDWFDSRASIYVNTLHAAYSGAKQLNDLNIPIYFVIGNHDLHLRNSRDVYSVGSYAEFDNFHVITEPTVVHDIVEPVLFSPYLFHEEYDTMHKYSDVAFWAGHFEFQGFRITGYNTKMEHGPNPSQFSSQRRILSGHFHARQTQKNITYIGNAFPMDYGDTGDCDRGCAIYDHTADALSFINWTEAPSYNKHLLSDILSNSDCVKPNSYTKCIVDVPLEYEQSVSLRQQLLASKQLREFSFEDVIKDDVLEDTTTSDVELTGTDVDQTVVNLLQRISDDTIDTSLLISEYQRLS